MLSYVWLWQALVLTIISLAPIFGNAATLLDVKTCSTTSSTSQHYYYYTFVTDGVCQLLPVAGSILINCELGTSKTFSSLNCDASTLTNNITLNTCTTQNISYACTTIQAPYVEIYNIQCDNELEQYLNLATVIPVASCERTLIAPYQYEVGLGTNATMSKVEIYNSSTLKVSFFSDQVCNTPSLDPVYFPLRKVALFNINPALIPFECTDGGFYLDVSSNDGLSIHRISLFMITFWMLTIVFII